MTRPGPIENADIEVELNELPPLNLANNGNPTDSTSKQVPSPKDSVNVLTEGKV